MALPTATHFDEDAVIVERQERQELHEKSPQHMSVDAYEQQRSYFRLSSDNDLLVHVRLDRRQ